MVAIPATALQHKARPRVSKSAFDRGLLLALIRPEGSTLALLHGKLPWARKTLLSKLRSLVEDGHLARRRVGRATLYLRTDAGGCVCTLASHVALRPILFAIHAGHHTARDIAGRINSISHDVATCLAHAAKRQKPLVARDGYVGRQTRWVLTPLGRTLSGECRCRT